jgi:PBP1b-binding outer membrane lipoprotein LpoB
LKKETEIMTKRLFVVLLLSLFVAACDSGTTEPNSNVNNAPKVNGTAPASPATSPSPEAAPSVKSELKVGDKVKVEANGSVAEATIVSVDQKAGKVTVKIPGQAKEKTVAIGEVKQ